MKAPVNSYEKTSIGRQQATRHWLYQRLGGLTLIVLGGWFLIAIRLYAVNTLEGMRQWLACPSQCIFMIIFLGVAFYHAHVGLQVIIEDYIPPGRQNDIFLKISKILCTIAALAGMASVIKLALF